MCNKIKRRSFIQLGLMGASSPLWLPSNRIFAADSTPEFMLHIHLGSWCGLSSGLVQPQEVGKWPKGAHFQNETTGSNNPNMNEHHKSGNFVFHDYSKPLQEHADQLMMATISSVALGHPEAKSYQQSGNLPNAPGAGWVAGFSDLAFGSKDKKLMVINSPLAGKPNSFTPNQVTMEANTMQEFNAASTDGNRVPRPGQSNDFSKAFWKKYLERFNSAALNGINRSTDETEKSDIEYTLNTLIDGFSGYNTNDSTYKSLASAISINGLRSKLDDLIDNTNAIMSTRNLVNENTFRNQLILAGMLAQKSTASGMSIQLGGGDLHNGGSDVITARSASKVWIQLMQFWTWVKQNNLDDKILVVVTHEFGRTAYNNSNQELQVFDGNSNINVNSPGRDHSLLTGMLFLNRNVPVGRVGGMGEAHTPLGSDDLRGIVNPNIEGYTSSNVMGSLMLRLFADKLKGDDRLLREYWNNFNQHIPQILG